MTPKERLEIAGQIQKRRNQCIVHRICYYVFSTTLVTDQQYDRFERELKALVDQYPDINNQQTEFLWCCPTASVGSSTADSYPPELVRLAESLIANAPKSGGA